MYTQDFAKLWSKLTKNYQSHMETYLAPSLTEAQLSVLELLDQREKMKPSDFIPFLATTPAAVTMLLDRMERAGLIVRERDLDDRRIVWVSITEKGQTETQRGLQIRNDFLGTVLDQISSHNQQLLIFLLGKITTTGEPVLNRERA
ncbi:DNA-binding MarR family transcriptional regulator [Paenibacillus shirakamiensis]|uniref:DNA-binding MarR family transcriptional regulator n=1 Tax=Paenibacillus shirakamiensis TaxID=1265935 RepID=A0ABS4JEY1_9BACL|nr:MarR family transcriptional regulator [Paenibacillus shirakamiensis]MBP1999630.1 DNA-binding MarR family transcriptional regulator [Paenibacillus shirakamiensis]